MNSKTRKLKPSPAEICKSKSDSNLIVNLHKGDSLTYLTNTKDSYNVIYLDPPFFTQRDHKMKGGRGTIKFSDMWKSREDYMNWLLKVYTLCWEHLTDDGTLYSHNNFHINAEILTILPDHIKRRFITNITWQRSHPHNNIKNSWGNIADSITVYSKTDSPFFSPQYTELDAKYKENSFNHLDNRGNYALAPIMGEKSRIGHKYEYSGYNPQYGWRKKMEDLQELDRQELLHRGKNKMYKKVYVEESKGCPIQNVWTDIYPLTRSEENKRQYPTQKPKKLLERIIKASCPNGGSVLDPFAGSGTTAMAAISTSIPSTVTLIDENQQAIFIIRNNLLEKVKLNEV